MVVYLVGSGPGDIELITLKAKRLIKHADIILYDRLSNEEILKWANPDCRLIYMGKRDKRNLSSQEIQKKINSILIKYGSDHVVVRLKGGDPFIFGRGGEEALICEKENIRFEIVPGISSFYAAPAYAGIPITHRAYNSGFAVLTGHESKKTKSKIDWTKLPDTIVVLMGVSNREKIAEELLKSGRESSTPVAVIRWGTTENQDTSITNLGELKKGVEGLKPPSIFVIGEIVNMHSKLNWFEKKMNLLSNRKIVIARARGHSDENISFLKRFNMEPIIMPLIEIVPKEYHLPELNDYDAIVFTSTEGVKRVGEKKDLKNFRGKFYAIGPKTKNRLLLDCGIEASFGKKYNSESLGQHILKNLEEGSKILLLRSSAATDLLQNMLQEKFHVSFIPVYDIKTLSADPEKVKKADAVFVFSSSCAKSLSKLENEILKKPTIISIGSETSKHLDVPHLTSREATFEEMFNTYLDYLWREAK